MASAQGGVDIEGVAAESPDAIITESVDVKLGLQLDQARKLATRVGFTESTVEDVSCLVFFPFFLSNTKTHPSTLTKAAVTMTKLYKLFVEKDATLVEINPMAVTSAGKSNFQDSCLSSKLQHLIFLFLFFFFFFFCSFLHGCQDQL